MKKLVKIMLSIVMLAGVLYAEPIFQSGEKNGYNVTLSSKNTLVTGNNEVYIKLSQDDVIVKDAKVKIKFFMPEMPGMPYMDYKAKAKLIGDTYKTQVNFAMSGTWQYQIKFKTQDGKVHKIRGSVNL